MADKDKFADEMLTDDELDAVTGGTYNQIEKDNRFLNDLFGRKTTSQTYVNLESDTVAAWKKVGITVETSFFSENKYYDENHNEITRNYAMCMAARACNKVSSTDFAAYV